MYVWLYVLISRCVDSPTKILIYARISIAMSDSRRRDKSPDPVLWYYGESSCEIRLLALVASPVFPESDDGNMFKTTLETPVRSRLPYHSPSWNSVEHVEQSMFGWFSILALVGYKNFNLVISMKIGFAKLIEPRFPLFFTFCYLTPLWSTSNFWVPLLIGCGQEFFKATKQRSLASPLQSLAFQAFQSQVEHLKCHEVSFEFMAHVHRITQIHDVSWYIYVQYAVYLHIHICIYI